MGLVIASANAVSGWQASIIVTSDSTDALLLIGQHPEATAGLDSDLEEFERPPLPPSSSFDVRFVGEMMEGGSLVDLRPPSVTRTDTLLIRLQPAQDSPIVLSWEPDSLARYTAVAALRDAFGGQLGIDVDMRKEGEFTLSDRRIDHLTVVLRTSAVGDTNTVSQIRAWAQVKLGNQQ
jgi:hypothetical protein